MPDGVNIAYGDVLEPDPSWTRLDTTNNLVAGWEVRRGRQDEFSRTGTGTATVHLNDQDGLVDPTITGELPQHVSIALKNPTGGYGQIYRGHVDDPTYDVNPSGVVTRVAIECVDAFDFLSTVEVTPGLSGNTVPAESEGNVFYEDGQVNLRMEQVLQDAEWPDALTTIFTGNVNVQETVYDPGASSLQVLQDAADAEFPGVANLYVARDGTVTFHGRFARFNPTDPQYGITTWQAATYPTTNVAHVRGLRFANPRKSIVNAARCTPQNILDADIAGQVVTDATSISKYGVRSWSAENILTLEHKTNGNTGLDECLLFATYYVENYQVPRPRVSQIVFRSISPDHVAGPATWDLMCNVEIGDIIDLSTTHPGGGGFNENFYVEGITYQVLPLNPDMENVTLTLDLSPAAYWTVDPF